MQFLAHGWITMDIAYRLCQVGIRLPRWSSLALRINLFCNQLNICFADTLVRRPLLLQPIKFYFQNRSTAKIGFLSVFCASLVQCPSVDYYNYYIGLPLLHTCHSVPTWSQIYFKPLNVPSSGFGLSQSTRLPALKTILSINTSIF